MPERFAPWSTVYQRFFGKRLVGGIDQEAHIPKLEVRHLVQQ